MIVTQKYEDEMVRLIKASRPYMTNDDIRRAVRYSIQKRMKDSLCTVENNYTKTKLDSTLAQMTAWILEKEPICTAYGVLFKRHTKKPHPLMELIKSFGEDRDAYKKKMFSFLEAHDYDNAAKYDLYQLLAKRDVNSIYGCLGNAACILYNLNVAASITAQGRAVISTATLFFEAFMANNVKFASLEEVLHYIDNVCMEAPTRKYNDSMILDRNIPLDECFAKIMMTCGDWRRGRFRWVPDFDDAKIIYNVLQNVGQENLNRLYYKNNLYAFLDNSTILNGIKYLLKTLKKPFLTPNEIPEEIKVELDAFEDFFREYVFYKYAYDDRIDRCNNMVKDVCVISDTDSTIISFDAFYHFVSDRLIGEEIPISQQEVRLTIDGLEEITEVPKVELGYDFFNDEVIERESMKRPFVSIPQNNLRYSIINIIAYISGNLCNEYVVEYTKGTHSYQEGRKCLLYLKNEFLFSRALLTNGKKNYASNQELKEGRILEQTRERAMDIKGMPLDKSTLNDAAQDELQKILYEEILRSKKIDQIRIIERIAILEKKIEDSLRSGKKDFYKPVAIKSMGSYEDPMGIQGIKAAVIWNAVRERALEPIDLDARNTVGIVKVIITPSNIEKIKDSHPEVFGHFIDLFSDKNFLGKGKEVAEITSLAIPDGVDTPQWVTEFIDYNNIINDNIKTFPFESCGITRLGSDKINYSTIMKI